MLKNIYTKLIAGIDKVVFCGILLFAFVSANGQSNSQSLKGRVIDDEGKPVYGAIVNVAESARIAVTDKDGNFELKKVELNDEVFVSLIGYKTTSVKGSTSEIVIEKIKDIYTETMATPFDRQQKKFVVNATSTVTGAELEKHPVTVLQNAFVGVVNGVATLETHSEPGWSESQMYIRGLRTTNVSARSPLIIVDNVERDLSFLDAYPIETITILKDAAATAIYGMRGANGVVLVTTKRGEAGRTKISFNQEFGYQVLSGTPEQQNSYNYALSVNQARYLDGNQPMYSDEDVQHYKEVCDGTLDPSLRFKYVNTNWYKEMLRDRAPQHRTNLSVSGGNDIARYYVSFTYLRQEGQYDERWTEMNDGYSTQHNLNRFNLRSNIDIDVTKGLNVSLDLGGRIDCISQPLASTWTIFTIGAAENNPTNPIYCPNGEFNSPSDNSEKNGPALIGMTGIDYNRRRNLYSNATVTGDLGFITKGLKIKAIVGFDSYNTFQYTQSQNFDSFYYDPDSGTADNPDSYTYTRKRTASALANPSTSPRDMSYNMNLIGSLNYDRVFADKHAVKAQAMVRTYKNVIEGYNSSRRYLTFGGIADYTYNNKYVAQIAASYMGSDNLAPDARFGFFPSLSLGWVASEEDFLKGSSVDLLKIRASIGRSGYLPISYSTLLTVVTDAGTEVRYPYEGKYAEGSGYNFGTSQTYQEGAYESTSGNKNNKWETSDMLNVGVDFDIRDGLIYGQLDAFKEWRSGILVTRATVPDMYGIASPLDSYGRCETKGFEFVLGHRNQISDFSYSVEGMVTFNRSKIIDIDEVAPTYDYQKITGTSIPYHSAVNTTDGTLRFHKVQWASDESKISTSQQDAIDNPEKYAYHGNIKLGNAIFEDTNGDRIIDNNDKTHYDFNRVPELIPSIRLGFGYKGFDARVLLTAYLNRTVECRENMDFGFGWGGTTTHEVTNTWGYYTDDPNDERNINALYPRLSMSFSDNDRNYPRNTSNIWLRNGNFLSLRNVEVGYTLPKNFTAKANISSCRVYFSGYNLCNWSHFSKGFDPEEPTNYVWAYPKTMSFSFGVNLMF